MLSLVTAHATVGLAAEADARLQFPGRTGPGKTTTLYAALRQITRP